MSKEVYDHVNQSSPRNLKEWAGYGTLLVVMSAGVTAVVIGVYTILRSAVVALGML